MTQDNFLFHSPQMSLRDLIGPEFADCVCGATAFLQKVDFSTVSSVAAEVVDFYPAALQQRCEALLDDVGTPCCPALSDSIPGAPTNSFRKAADNSSAPLTGLGYLRVGQDGILRLIAKSEHYHASLGHGFPGYGLIDMAKKIGITNVTHNNTRGYITRLLERELVRTAHGLDKEDTEGLEAILASQERHVLNRVINLETGSIACEAALKMMLARFYDHEATPARLPSKGKIPVIFVMADNDGGRQANYHGTNFLNQMLRGMWPELYRKMASAGAFQIQSVRINDAEHFAKMVAEWNTQTHQVAGFFHEIILMNYGAVKLHQGYLQKVYDICSQHDIPTCCDEIQSCVWYPELFLFRDYGLRPDFVTLGKGFPGGQYPASKVLTTAAMDNLSQFGALVTNGQEELASISYLVTMAFAAANSSKTTYVGDYYESELRQLAQRYPDVVTKVEGYRHLSSIYFHQPEKAVAFCRFLNQQGIDISAHTYKANCEPSALTKLPLIATPKVVNFIIARMTNALESIK